MEKPDLTDKLCRQVEQRSREYGEKAALINKLTAMGNRISELEARQGVDSESIRELQRQVHGLVALNLVCR